jgi:hypothetical protein
VPAFCVHCSQTGRRGGGHRPGNGGREGAGGRSRGRSGGRSRRRSRRESRSSPFPSDRWPSLASSLRRCHPFLGLITSAPSLCIWRQAWCRGRTRGRGSDGMERGARRGGGRGGGREGGRATVGTEAAIGQGGRSGRGGGSDGGQAGQPRRKEGGRGRRKGRRRGRGRGRELKCFNRKWLPVPALPFPCTRRGGEARAQECRSQKPEFNGKEKTPCCRFLCRVPPNPFPSLYSSGGGEYSEWDGGCSSCQRRRNDDGTRRGTGGRRDE